VACSRVVGLYTRNCLGRYDLCERRSKPSQQPWWRFSRRSGSLAQGERADVAVLGVEGASSRSQAEEDGAGGMVVVGTEENPVGEEAVPRLGHGVEVD
jgi:hypothetical protein